MVLGFVGDGVLSLVSVGEDRSLAMRFSDALVMVERITMVGWLVMDLRLP